MSRGVLTRNGPLSSSAKADDPVTTDLSIQNRRLRLLDAPHSRGMTGQRLWQLNETRETHRMKIVQPREVETADPPCLC
jgi:hypothetical protein